jgi:hypothetical protein
MSIYRVRRLTRGVKGRTRVFDGLPETWMARKAECRHESWFAAGTPINAEWVVLTEKSGMWDH